MGNNPVNYIDPKGLAGGPGDLFIPLFIAAVEYQAELTTATVVAAEVATGAPTPLSAELSAAGAVASNAERLYINGSRTPLNMTPRPVDVNGLSAFNNLKNALPGKNQIIDPSKFNNLTAICDKPKTGHVSITPKDMSQMQDWINSRGGADVHPLTQELIDAIVGTVKK